MTAHHRKIQLLAALIVGLLAMHSHRLPAAPVPQEATTDGTLNGADLTDVTPADASTPAPLKLLLITGGCCHDYPRQTEIITQGVSARANVVWEIFRGSDNRDQTIGFYQSDDWAKGYDLVVHNECYGGVTDVGFVERMVRGHTKNQIPAVVIHCTMHSYRNARTDAWRQLLGVTSRRHEKVKRQLDVVTRQPEHPIMRGFPGSWQTPNGELYVIERSWPDCNVLATAYGVESQEDHPVIWTNTYQGTRLFGTTLGHHNETMMAEPWLNVVTAGILWACNKIDEDGKPVSGYELPSVDNHEATVSATRLR